MRAADDHGLLEKARNGDGRAFGKLVEKYTGVVYAAVRSVLGNRNDVDDAVQEAFIRIYRGLHTFSGRSSLSTWIWSVARNHALNIRSGERQDVIPLEQTSGLASDRFDPEKEFARRRAAEDIEWLLSTLDGETRQVIELRYLAGRKYVEISDMLGMPEGTVKTVIHRARIRMKSLMNGKTRSERRKDEAANGM